MKHYDEAIAEFQASKPIVIDPSLPEAIKPFFHSLENPNNLPFSRELWAYSLQNTSQELMNPCWW